MYCKRLGRLVSGLYRCRSGLSRAAVRGQRSAGLQRSAAVWSPCPTASCHFSTRSSFRNTVDPDEVRRFQSLAGKWWDEQGEFAALHAMNDLRVPFIRDNLLNVHTARHPGKPLAGLRILDVGCGGGLLTEPLGRLGANVVGIDPVEDSISTAQLHASYDPDVRASVSYQACTLEELSADGEEEQGAGQFDAVVASEVVEHLADLETFAFCSSHVLKSTLPPLLTKEERCYIPVMCTGLSPLKALNPLYKYPPPGGSLFITTINKTNLSYALGIVVAERLLRIVPSGTHDWEKFISPVDLERLLASNGFSVQSVLGMLYNPVSGAWSWTNSTAINYALHAVKLSDDPQPDRAEDSGPHPEHHSAATHS